MKFQETLLKFLPSIEKRRLAWRVFKHLAELTALIVVVATISTAAHLKPLWEFSFCFCISWLYWFRVKESPKFSFMFSVKNEFKIPQKDAVLDFERMTQDHDIQGGLRP